MTRELSQLSNMGRRAVESYDWATVGRCAQAILLRDRNSAEGYFLLGQAERANKQALKSSQAFEKALELDPDRYDAAIELARQYSKARRNGDAAKLLSKYRGKLENSPRYLDLAGTVYTEIGMARESWPLFQKANELQPGVDLFQANLATCAVYLGEIDQARTIYQDLLKRFPDHRRNHYQLSRLAKATDFSHVDQMKEILGRGEEQQGQNIPLYFAIGKELEDLEQWDESFEYYRQGGDKVNEITRYEVQADLDFVDKIIEVCDADWLAQPVDQAGTVMPAKTPIFIVGLPRTGTTLTERILSSHSKVETLGETLFLQQVLRSESGVQSSRMVDSSIIEAVAGKSMSRVADRYMDALSYRMGDEPMFIDKLPLNFLYLGFIARAWPDARIVHLVRNPMDACFSMFKQVFTWAYGYSYSLDTLGKYYLAYDRLRRHWQDVLHDRVIEVHYESLVTDPEHQTRYLLERLGLEFEPACLNFDQNEAPSSTASSVQVREGVHTGSVNKWTRYAQHLEPMRAMFENAGIPIE